MSSRGYCDTPPPGSPFATLGATHGAEMPYVFDHLDQQPLPWADADRRLAAAMATYWTNFAKTGDPNGAGLAGIHRGEPAGPVTGR